MELKFPVVFRVKVIKIMDAYDSMLDVIVKEIIKLTLRNREKIRVRNFKVRIDSFIDGSFGLSVRNFVPSNPTMGRDPNKVDFQVVLASCKRALMEEIK